MSKQGLLGLRRNARGGSTRSSPPTAAPWPTSPGRTSSRRSSSTARPPSGSSPRRPGPYPQEAVVPPQEMTHIRDEINRVTQSRRMLAHGLVTPAARPGRPRLHGPAGGHAEGGRVEGLHRRRAQGLRPRLVRGRREDRLPDAGAGAQARRASASASTRACRSGPVADYNHPRDVIKAAKDFPDIDFLALSRGPARRERAPSRAGEVPWTTEFCRMKKKEPGALATSTWSWAPPSASSSRPTRPRARTCWGR